MAWRNETTEDAVTWCTTCNKVRGKTNNHIVCAATNCNW